jgi:hypothetical protein
VFTYMCCTYARYKCVCVYMCACVRALIAIPWGHISSRTCSRYVAESRWRTAKYSVESRIHQFCCSTSAKKPWVLRRYISREKRLILGGDLKQRRKWCEAYEGRFHKLVQNVQTPICFRRARLIPVTGGASVWRHVGS